MRDEKEGKGPKGQRAKGPKGERSKQGQTNKQSKPNAVTFPNKNKNGVPRVGLEPTTLYTLDTHRVLYLYMCTCFPVQTAILFKLLSCCCRFTKEQLSLLEDRDQTIGDLQFSLDERTAELEEVHNTCIYVYMF